MTGNHIARMKELNEVLSKAADAYYNEDREIMSNYEYDALYDELVTLEEECGEVLPNSITQRAGAPLPNDTSVSTSASSVGLPKVEHDSPMLSLDKTKSRAKLTDWLADKTGCLSWKLDGSTVVLTYDGGSLIQAVTRGNGRIGEDITRQARKFAFVPTEISYKGRLVVRGEALMTYTEFERINATIDDVAARYKNPRNLASGTMRALDDTVLDEREICFYPFTLVSADDETIAADGFEPNSYCARLDWLDTLGFRSVEYYEVSADTLDEKVSAMETAVESQDVPSDGLVLFFDDVAYGDSLGSTGHAPKNGIAFKWADETADTSLTDIVWQPSRTGRINPVAMFEPVELEGTTVERATLNNITFMRDMLGGFPRVGQSLRVYKANKIIPTVVWADKTFPSRGEETALLSVPTTCPSCGGETHIVNEHGSEFLMCENDECPAKHKESMAHFASRDALDIRGLSKETISRLMEAGVVAGYADILDIADKRDEVVGHIEGIGVKSFDNLVAAVETAKETTAARFLYALGIREIGRSASADIAKVFGNDIEKVIETACTQDEKAFSAIDGIGNVMAHEIVHYLTRNKNMVEDLLSRVEITDKGEVVQMHNDFIAGKTFVVTGKVSIFAKRDDLKAYITENGGKLSGSVSKNTDYLITDHPDDDTAKTLKARELGTPIINEAQFCHMAGYAE